MKRPLLAASLSALALAAYAQTSPPMEEPAVPDSALRLPDTESEVRAVLPGAVEAPLPQLPAVPLPEAAPPLPAVGELAGVGQQNVALAVDALQQTDVDAVDAGHRRNGPRLAAENTGGRKKYLISRDGISFRIEKIGRWDGVKPNH